jgi:hypothetical protein
MHSRPAAVAGLFYPNEKERLQQTIANYMRQAQRYSFEELKALVVPHAGYIYSGAIAATAYQALATRKEPIRRIILLGPAHRLAFNGVVESGHTAYRTPIGELKCDQVVLKQLQDCSLVHVNEIAHRDEHSLEVQLPFISTLFDDSVTLVPLLAGMDSEDVLLRILETVWHKNDLIIVSSDLSHYLVYEEAKRKDQATTLLIEQLQPCLNGYQACGCHPLNALIQFAKNKGWRAKCLDLRNSGDTAGNQQRVVGYGSYVFY